MTLWLDRAWSLRRPRASSLVTVEPDCLAGGLLMSVGRPAPGPCDLHRTKRRTGCPFRRGAKLQLVLNAIFHLEASLGICPTTTTPRWRPIRPSPSPSPSRSGTITSGYRLVGTPHQYFLTEYRRERRRVEPGGRLFGDGYREAVLGSLPPAGWD